LLGQKGSSASVEIDAGLKWHDDSAMISSRLAPAYASLTLLVFVALAYPLTGRDVFVGAAGVTLIACIHLWLTKNSR
jgi:hypothetical protein